MKMVLTGIKEFLDKGKKIIRNAERRVVDKRRRVAIALVEEIAAQIPVWSGNTLYSLYVAESGVGGRNLAHPQRRDRDPDGKEWMPSEVYGRTSRMAMGSEPMRGLALAVAIESAKGASYALSKSVHVTNDYYLWGRVSAAQAPTPQSARNNVIASQSAIQTIRLRFGI